MPKKLSTSTKAASRYNNDCSAKGIVSNFLKIRKDAAVPKTLTTGNKMLDYVLQSRVASKAPYVGYGIKAINTSPQVGAHVAHGINAYNESCRSRKKK